MDTWGAEFHADLDVDGPVVRKGSNGEDGYSGFTMRDPTTGETEPTELAELLRGRGVTRLVVCGLATDYCVNSTALDGIKEGFRVRVLFDAIRAVDLEQGDGERAIAEVERAGGEIVR
jgi:nicotinamidase/pyrazinamidase